MHKTTVRVPMPPSRRAKQYASFDALKGLKEAIAAKERRPEPRRELTEDKKAEINLILTNLRKGQLITLVYYGEREQASLQIAGEVIKVDAYGQILQVKKVAIKFAEIYKIITIE